VKMVFVLLKNIEMLPACATSTSSLFGKKSHRLHSQRKKKKKKKNCGDEDEQNNAKERLRGFFRSKTSSPRSASPNPNSWRTIILKFLKPSGDVGVWFLVGSKSLVP